MQSHRWLIFAPSAALLIALVVSVAACGGGSDDDDESSTAGEIPTATLPATLPDPIILGESEAPPGSGSTYTVQEGDSPSSIAAQFGITTEELMAANGITDPTALFVGQVLTIPGAGAPQVSGQTPTPPAATDVPAELPTASSGGQTYVVQEGDIPETIAAQFGITADELMAANGITDPTALFVGQELTIPAPSG